MADESATIEEQATVDSAEDTVEPAEEENGSRSGPGFILGVLLGMLAGAIGAMLFTPATGDEVRQRPGEEAGPVLTHPEGEGGPGSPQWDAPMAQFRGALDRVRSRMREASEQAQEAAREAEEQSRARYEDLTKPEEPPA